MNLEMRPSLLKRAVEATHNRKRAVEATHNKKRAVEATHNKKRAVEVTHNKKRAEGQHLETGPRPLSWATANAGKGLHEGHCMVVM